MNAEHPNNQTEETPIFYDCREPQKIPLLVPKGNGKVRITHHLKPLTNERYFQFIEETEEVAFNDEKKLSAIYKPHFDLWRELFIERDGIKTTDTDALFFEAASVIKGLLYYEKVIRNVQSSDEPVFYDDHADTDLYFGAMFSGAWLGLELTYKNEFDCKQTDKYFSEIKNKRRWIGNRLKFVSTRKFFTIYNFALPFVAGAKGYAQTDNIADVIPAWHIIHSADQIQSQAIEFLADSPVINQVFGQ